MKKLENGNFAIAPKAKLSLDHAFSDHQSDRMPSSKLLKKKRKSDETIKSRKAKKAKIDKSNPNWKLQVRPHIQVLEKDPLFEGNEALPFISSSANSHLITRAVLNYDNAQLKKMLDDRKIICDVNKPRSLATTTTPLGKKNLWPA